MIFNLYNYLKNFNNEVLFMDNEIEIWKDIGIYDGIDYTGLYESSTFGNVRSLDRETVCKNGRVRHSNGKILKQYITKTGYNIVGLCKNGSSRIVSVHRLIMNTHNPNPNPELYTDINHIDEDKTNNRLSNLEWVTHKQNMNHGTIKERLSKVRQKEVVQLANDGTFVKKWNCISDAKDLIEYHIKTAQNLLYMNGIVYDKYIWMYFDKYTSISNEGIKDILNKNNSKRLLQIALDGTIIKEWESVKQIDNSINWFNKQSFLQMQRMGFCFYKNYLWMTHYKYYEELKCNIESFIKKYKQDTRYDNYCKKIVQVDADGNIVNVWKSVGEASEELKISREAVSKRINGKIKGNDTLFLFAYDYYNSVSQKDIVKCIGKQKEKSQRRSLKIVQLDKNNNFIKEWGSIKSAASELGICTSSIWNCINGKYLQANGFKWMYSKDYYAQ